MDNVWFRTSSIFTMSLIYMYNSCTLQTIHIIIILSSLFIIIPADLPFIQDLWLFCIPQNVDDFQLRPCGGFSRQLKLQQKDHSASMCYPNSSSKTTCWEARSQGLGIVRFSPDRHMAHDVFFSGHAMYNVQRGGCLERECFIMTWKGYINRRHSQWKADVLTLTMRSHALCKSFRKNKKSAGFDAHMALPFLVKETNRWEMSFSESLVSGESNHSLGINRHILRWWATGVQSPKRNA